MASPASAGITCNNYRSLKCKLNQGVQAIKTLKRGHTYRLHIKPPQCCYPDCPAAAP